MTPSASAVSADEILAEMAAAGRTALEEAPLARTRPTLKRVRYTHEDCIDRILADPGISQNELAAVYGFSAGWMSIAVNSDAFQARLAARRSELVDPVLAASINERFRAVTMRSLEVLAEKLAKPADVVPDRLALEAAALGAKSLGLGAAPPPPSATDHLANLAHRLLDLQGGHRPRDAGEVIDV